MEDQLLLMWGECDKKCFINFSFVFLYIIQTVLKSSVFHFLSAANFLSFGNFLCPVLQISIGVQYCIRMLQTLKSNLSIAISGGQ